MFYHVKDLQFNARVSKPDPRFARILLEAFGENKADAVKGMIEGPDTPELPASILQNHPDVTVIIDETSEGALNLEPSLHHSTENGTETEMVSQIIKLLLFVSLC